MGEKTQTVLGIDQLDRRHSGKGKFDFVIVSSNSTPVSIDTFSIQTGIIQVLPGVLVNLSREQNIPLSVS